MSEDEMKVKYKFNEISTKLMHVHLTRADEWLQTRLGSRSNFRISEPMECEVEFFRDEKSVHLKGEINARLLLACVKCLDEFGFVVRKEFSTVLFNSPEFSTQMEELELTAETINEEFLEDGVLDLENVVLEELLLSVPDYPRCNEDCKGLCPECGTNLNHEQCNCSKNNGINQFDSLKILLER
jgi:uncharacterized protein